MYDRTSRDSCTLVKLTHFNAMHYACRIGVLIVFCVCACDAPPRDIDTEGDWWIRRLLPLATHGAFGGYTPKDGDVPWEWGLSLYQREILSHADSAVFFELSVQENLEPEDILKCQFHQSVVRRWTLFDRDQHLKPLVSRILNAIDHINSEAPHFGWSSYGARVWHGDDAVDLLLQSTHDCNAIYILDKHEMRYVRIASAELKPLNNYLEALHWYPIKRVR